ncbi:hypothetical protein C7C46_11695 [Streptomyces tateyamensis]|uniref:Uncharacterized protein n=1 Tax=Streptomyces tateyamensis TaxID=565073 RepID=A0A2V4NAW4_9ACTN|nr:hypothetical protein [Streptomyces tateyamensis]PYC81369.1 hypothetical protein C7C46_11695 [Streptomyces tateyamensis]
MFDFILFDQQLCYEVSGALPLAANWTPVIATTRLVLQAHKLARRIQRFDDLWSIAEPVAGTP